MLSAFGSLLTHVVSLSLLPVLEGFLDFVHKVVVVHHIVLDLIDGKLDKHTSDLWCLLITN